MTAGHPFPERNPLRRLLIPQPGAPRLAFARQIAEEEELVRQSD